MLYLQAAVAQVWSHVHWFHLTKEQRITLAKSKALGWVREANWLPMQTDECHSQGRRERDLTLSFQWAVSSLAASSILSLNHKSKEPILPLKTSVLTRKTWEGLGKTTLVGKAFACYHTLSFNDRAVYQDPSNSSVWTNLLPIPSNLFKFFENIILFSVHSQLFSLKQLLLDQLECGQNMMTTS